MYNRNTCLKIIIQIYIFSCLTSLSCQASLNAPLITDFWVEQYDDLDGLTEQSENNYATLIHDAPVKVRLYRKVFPDDPWEYIGESLPEINGHSLTVPLEESHPSAWYMLEADYSEIADVLKTSGVDIDNMENEEILDAAMEYGYEVIQTDDGEVLVYTATSDALEAPSDPDALSNQVTASPKAVGTKIYLRHSDGRLCIWAMDTNGTLDTSSDRYKTSVPISSQWSLKKVVDVDGDGAEDLIMRNASNGRILVWFISTDGYLSSESSAYTINEVVSLTWSITEVTDIDGDSIPDLILRNSMNGRILVWFMANDGSLSTDPSAYAINDSVSSDWVIRQCKDINGDSIPDLVMRNQRNGRILVWFMANNGTLSSDPSAYTINEVVSMDWVIKECVDVDGDSVPDLVMRNQRNGRVLIWFMANDGTLSVDPSSYTINDVVSLSWSIHSAKDVDNDGTPDLILRNASNGRVLTWFMANNGSLSVDPSAYTINESVSTSWSIQN